MAEYTVVAAEHKKAVDGRNGCECGCGGFTTNRFLRGHNKKLRTPDYEVVDAGYETPCWLWLKAQAGGGYGTTAVGRAMRPAHRVYYERLVGLIPDGMQLDHLCRNRRCVNPEHLEPVTNAENARRGAKTKLTSHDVEVIRTTDLPTWLLADILGVHISTVQKIKAGTERTDG